MAMEFMVVPPWLEEFLSITTFFTECEEHTERVRRECNMYCFDCSSDKPLCLYCVKYCHKNHRTIQIRRSTYQNVVRVEDIKDELDTSGIQPYVINKFRVVFLNKRGFGVHKNKGTGKNCSDTSLCNICSRNISNPSRFCSLGCKFAWTKRSENGNTDQSTNTSEGLKEIEEEEISKRLASKEKAQSNTSNSRKRKGIPFRAPFY